MVILAFYSSIMIILICASLYKPTYAVTAAFFMFGLDQLGFVSHPIFSKHGYLTNLLIGLVVSFAFIRHFFKTKSISIYKHKALLLVAALIAWSLITIFWSPNPSFAYNKWLMQIPYWIVFVVLVPLLVRTEEMLHKNYRLIIMVALPFLFVFVFLVQWGFRSIIIPGGGIEDESLGLPLALSELGGYLLIVSILLMSEKTMKWKLLRVTIALLACVLIIKTGSRGQLFLAVGISVLILPFVVKNFTIERAVALMAVTIVILAAAIFLFDSFSEGGEGRWQADVLQNVYSARLQNAFRLVATAASNPATFIFGLGNSASFDQHILGFYPHVVPLEILAEEGIVGFCILIAVVVYAYSRSRLALKVADSPLSRNLVAIVIALMIFQFGLSFKQGSLLGSQWMFGFLVILDRLVAIILERRYKTNRLIGR